MMEIQREAHVTSRYRRKPRARYRGVAPDEDFPGVALLAFSSCKKDTVGAIRERLSSLEIHDDIPRYDAGTITIEGDLRAAAAELSDAVLEYLEEQHLVVVLGGVPDTTFASHRGLRAAVGLSTTVALEARFDLNPDSVPQQLSGLEQSYFSYSSFSFSPGPSGRSVCPSSIPPQTQVTYADQLARMTPREAADAALAKVAEHPFIHLSIDLSILTMLDAGGVGLAHIQAVITALAGTGRLKLIDLVAPDARTHSGECRAQTAACLIEEAVRATNRAEC